MKIAEKYNKNGRKFTWEMPANSPYYKMKEIYNDEKIVLPAPVKGLYISTKGKYGAQPVLISENYFMNMPSFYLDTVKEMLNDEEFVNAVNANRVYFDIEEYTKDGQQRYSITWIDLD